MRDYVKETKQCLEGYKECRMMLESKINALNRLREDRMKRVEGKIGVSSIQYDSVPLKTNKVVSKVEEIAIKNAQLEQDLETSIEDLRYYLNRIDMNIEELKPEWRDIIKVRYMEGNTWRYTAVEVGQSDATCRRYAEKAIKSLADKLVGQKSYIDLPLFRDIYVEQALA